MYLLTFTGVLAFLLAQHTHSSVVFSISTVIAAGCFGLVVFWFSEDRDG